MCVSKWLILTELGQGLREDVMWGGHIGGFTFTRSCISCWRQKIKWKEKHFRKGEQHKEMDTARGAHRVTRKWEVSESNRK